MLRAFVSYVTTTLIVSTTCIRLVVLVVHWTEHPVLMAPFSSRCITSAEIRMPLSSKYIGVGDVSVDEQYIMTPQHKGV